MYDQRGNIPTRTRSDPARVMRNETQYDIIDVPLEECEVCARVLVT